jgi:hypothetical protein
MTVAAIEALVLRESLRHGEKDLPRRFFRASAKKIRIAWLTAAGSDLALPEVNGRAPLSIRLSNAYLDRVMTAAERDSAVMLSFLRVMGMMDSPARLLLPGFMFRVFRMRRAPQDTAQALSATQGDAEEAIDHASSAGTSITR